MSQKSSKTASVKVPDAARTTETTEQVIRKKAYEAVTILIQYGNILNDDTLRELIRQLADDLQRNTGNIITITERTTFPERKRMNQR